MKLKTVLAFAAGVCATLASALGGNAIPPQDDEVLYWNNVLLDLYRLDFGTGCPGPLVRKGTIVQTAIFDAVNSIDRTYQPYVGFVTVPGAGSTASKEAAVMAAAYRSMLVLFPNSQTTLTQKYQQRKALLTPGKDTNDGIKYGNRAASACIQSRQGDGSEVSETYAYGSAPGSYIPTPPAFSIVPCNPEWARVRPFCMTSGSQFRTKPLGFRNMASLLASTGYAAQLNEVKLVGSRNSSVRTDEQTQIAFFWANDKNGTYKPPGHLFAITQTISRQRGLSLTDNARLFALVALAMGDASIAAWDAKFATDIDLWRPVTAVRQAHRDGNALTERDPHWLPLNEFTPPFPAYVSGHATFGAAHAGVLAEFFGTDDMTVTIDSEDPYYNALPNHPTRTFNKFSQMAIENGLSRVYLGVHFRMDASDGNAMGFNIGHRVGKDFLQPRCPGDYNRDGIVDGSDFFGFMTVYSVGDTRADFDKNGTVNYNDMMMYMNAYVSDCPD